MNPKSKKLLLILIHTIKLTTQISLVRSGEKKNSTVEKEGAVPKSRKWSLQKFQKNFPWWLTQIILKM